MAMASLAQRGDDETREAGIKILKQGLMWNLRSPRSWHIQGLYYRNDKQYAEALKSYSQVAKVMTNEGRQPSAQLLQDICGFQAQLGKWDEYIDTRRQILVLPNINTGVHWPGFAVGAHMARRYDISVAALDSYQLTHRGTQMVANTGTVKPSVEETELCLFRVEVLYQKRDFTAALSNLEANQANIMDTYAYNMYKIRLLIELDQFEQAREILLTQILKNNFDHLEGIILFFKTYGVSLQSFDATNAEQYSIIKNIFTKLLTEFPKSNTLIKLSLQYYQNDDIAIYLESYLKPNLSKGVPSLFKTLKGLYTNKFILHYIETLLLNYIASLSTSNFFPNDTQEQTPTTLLSIYVYLAQHYDYLGDIDHALKYLDLAEKHTPTFIDLYVYRAKIYKHMGNHQAAYYWIDYARSLDTADRWLNNKCTMYAYQAGHDDEAERTIQLFIKDKDGIHAYNYREQASWWYYQAGTCYAKYAKNYQLAIKSLCSIDDFFQQYQEGIHDYHQYCMRKCVLRAYTGMISYLQCVKTHKFYLKFVLQYVQLLLSLHYQAQFELKLNQIDNISEYIPPSNAFTTEKAAKETLFQTRESFLWRVQHLEEQQKKKCPMEDYEYENAGATTHHPNYDLFGYEYYIKTFIKKMFPQSEKTPADSFVFVKEAQRIIQSVLDAFNKDNATHTKMSRITEEAQNNTSHGSQMPPAILLLSARINILLNKPLNAVKNLTHVSIVVNEMKNIFNNTNLVNIKTRDQMLKTHYNGLQWFNLQHTTSANKIALLPLFYQAEIDVVKMMLTQLISQVDFVQTPMAQNEIIISAYQRHIVKALDNGVIYSANGANIQQLLQQQLTTALAQTHIPTAIINIAALLQASYYTNTTIDISAISTFIVSIATTSVTENIHTPLNALLSAIQRVQGTVYQSPIDQSIPSILGLPHAITAPEQATFEIFSTQNDLLSKLHSNVQALGSKLYPIDTTFMNFDQIATNNSQYAVNGPQFELPSKKD